MHPKPGNEHVLRTFEQLLHTHHVVDRYQMKSTNNSGLLTVLPRAFGPSCPASDPVIFWPGYATCWRRNRVIQLLLRHFPLLLLCSRGTATGRDTCVKRRMHGSSRDGTSDRVISVRFASCRLVRRRSVTRHVSCTLWSKRRTPRRKQCAVPIFDCVAKFRTGNAVGVVDGRDKAVYEFNC